MEIILEVLLECIIDCLKMLPILYISYLLMELLEHKAGKKMRSAIAKVGRTGPIIGAGLGIIPQCGFSGAVAGLYAGGIATAGTVIAVMMSTSDEMLPILISDGVDGATIGSVLLCKFLCGAAAGFLVDLFIRRPHSGEIHELCEQEHCACEKHNIWVSSAIHCAQVLGIIFAVTFVLALVFEFGGGDIISSVLPDIPVVGEMITGLLGLIPSCSASVLLTELYTEGVISAGMMTSGLCTNGGVGLLVLFRLNRDLKDNLRLVGILYAAGVLSGLIFGFVM